jgi:hypothetical protein
MECARNPARTPGGVSGATERTLDRALIEQVENPLILVVKAKLSDLALGDFGEAL